MIPILYKPNETDFVHNGIGPLVDTLSCIVTENRNGTYEAEFVYPTNGTLYTQITEDCLFKAKSNETSEPQLFRIYKSSKPMNKKVTFYGEHISYRLNGIPIETVEITSSNAQTALSNVLAAGIFEHNFTGQSDIETLNSTSLSLISIRAALGGVEGSLLDVYGGEYEFDNFVVKLHAHRGRDTGIRIAYGKNLTDIKQDRSISEVYTAVYPYVKYTPGATDDDPVPSEITITLPEKVIYSQYADRYAHSRAYIKDFTEMFEQGEEITVEKLRAKAQSWVKTSDFDIPTVSTTVAFKALWDSPEYAKYAVLERVALCDTLSVFYEDLGVSAKAKVIKTVFDALKEKYISIELGDARSNLADTLHQAANATTDVKQEIKKQTTATESKITQTSNNIMMEVNKKVDDSEFGTRIIQSYLSVCIAWNSISEYIEFADGAINIYKSTARNASNLLMKMTYSGAWYYYSGTTIGKIGTNAFAGDDNFRGLVFDLENDADYMCWAHKENSSDTAYTVKLIYYANNKKNNQGLHFQCKTYCGGNLYINDAIRTVNYADGSGGLYSTSNEISVQGKGCLFSCGTDFRFESSTNYLVDCYNNIDLHNYSILNQSDARYKTNIKPTQIEALPLLSKIELKEFDWIESGDHCDIGMIAQQLQEILPSLVDENKETGRLSIKTDKIVPYLIKALQEVAAYIPGDIATFSADSSIWVDAYTATEKTDFIAANTYQTEKEIIEKGELLIPINKEERANE